MSQNVAINQNDTSIIHSVKKECLPEITEFTESKLTHLGCTYRLLINFSVALDELFNNIISYGGYNDTPLFVIVEVSFLSDKNGYCLKISDNGKPFNLLKFDNPDINKPAEKYKAGGLGIFIVRKLMDEIKYSYSDGMNVVELIQKY